MPKNGGYGTKVVGETVATQLKRKPLSQPSGYASGGMGPNPATRTPVSGPAGGKFAGLPKGPSGGAMNTGGKRRPFDGHRVRGA